MAERGGGGPGGVITGGMENQVMRALVALRPAQALTLRQKVIKGSVFVCFRFYFYSFGSTA